MYKCFVLSGMYINYINHSVEENQIFLLQLIITATLYSVVKEHNILVGDRICH